MKLCTKCRETKPLTSFPKDRSRKDGLNNKCRACCLKQWQEWRAKNLERSQQYHREYRSRTPEERQQRAAARTPSTPESRAVYTNAWYKRNAAAAKARAKAWKKANPGRDSEVSTNWRKKYPDRHRQRSARYRARKRNNTVGLVDYEEIIVRDKNICHICEQTVLSEDRSFDHVIPLSKGGPHSMENIKLSHLKCNIRKGAR